MPCSLTCLSFCPEGKAGSFFSIDIMRHTFFKFLTLTASALALVTLAGCTRGAKISLHLEGGDLSREIVVKALDMNKYTPLDTLKANSKGDARCSVKIEKGQPEFFYLYDGGAKVASLLLERGDEVRVTLDSLGGCTVSGSEECERLQKVENDFKEASDRLSDIAYDINRADNETEAAALRREMGQTYIDYYRKCVKYVIENSHSLTVIPVFYQSFSDELPVFGQETDGITVGNVADSLATVYPDSKYVKALKEDAKKRMDYMALLTNIRTAEPVSLLDVELPDINAQKRKLSEVGGKLVMLHFWSASDPSQCQFNLEVLKKFYAKYHSRGFEIYSVALDLDKTNWAKVISEQKLPWINVCDSNGANSKLIALYNISALPTSYFICNGSLVNEKISDEKSLDALITKLLK